MPQTFVREQLKLYIRIWPLIKEMDQLIRLCYLLNIWSANTQTHLRLAQHRQSLHYSYTQSKIVDKDSGQN